jgi:hypothetical protein
MNNFNRRFLLFLSVILGALLLVLVINSFSNHHYIYESNGLYQIYAPKKWKLKKHVIPNTIVTADGDTAFWILMRANDTQWTHYMQYYPDNSQRGEPYDTTIEFIDTLKSVKILIRKLSPYHTINGETKVCFQIGVYSPGRFNFIYGLLSDLKYEEVKEEIKNIGKSLKSAPPWIQIFSWK